MDSLTSVVYTAVATSTGDGRNGHVQTDDKLLDLDLSTPSQGATATNPEQLFAAGYAACFHSALKRGARRLGHDVIDSAVTAEVDLGKVDDARFGGAVTLRVEIGGGISADDAQKIAEAAHHVCPYSNATRGNIDVTLDVEVG